jgi:uncharacterized membrane protein
MKGFLKNLFLFTVGGVLYYLMEILWRGYSHWSMFLLGGVSFLLLGLINEVLSWEAPMLLQMALGAAVITLLEFNVGCLVNLRLGWAVWDYSDMKFQFMGQISLKSSILWFFLSALGIVLDDCLRYRFFGEEKPSYRLI